ncbi:WAS/WASL-interacting protein family member 3, partial [Astyanax mexicanus]
LHLLKAAPGYSRAPPNFEDSFACGVTLVRSERAVESRASRARAHKGAQAVPAAHHFTIHLHIYIYIYIFFSQSLPDPVKAPPSEGGGRSALLADIHRGMRLKKVSQVNDRSAPVFHSPSKASGVDGGGNNGGSSGGLPAQGPTLSGLFAAGFPVLRPVGQRDKIQHHSPVSRSGSSASLKQPLWNVPSQGDSLRRSTPDLSPSHRALERTASLTKPRPASSYTAPPSPSQPAPPSLKPQSPASSTMPPPPPPPPLSLYPERSTCRPPPLPTSPPPPPPPQITKPTWLPVQSHYIPMPTTPPPPPPPSVPPSTRPPDRSPGFFYAPPLSPGVLDVRFGSFRDAQGQLGSPPPPPPPPLPASFSPSLPSSLPPTPPPLPPKVPAVPPPTYRPAVPPLPPSYPCTAPSRRPPAIPRTAAGAGRLAPPPAPPARSPTTELSSRIPPPPPPLPPAPPSSIRNGHLYSLDDFESKFQFHPIEDFPPPEEFKPFPRIYPSKENRVISQLPGMRSYMR